MDLQTMYFVPINDFSRGIHTAIMCLLCDARGKNASRYLYII